MRAFLPLPGVFIVLLLAGCSSRDNGGPGPHTHLSVDGRRTNIWTYEKVSTQELDGERTKLEKHLVGKMKSGEVFTLENGTKIRLDGERLMVGDFLVPADTLNVLVASDGTCKLNTFIRTFD